MARKTATTTRQRQSQQIMRDKQARKRREEIRRKIQFAMGVALGILFVGGGGYFWYSGSLERTVDQTVNGFYVSTARAGFAVHSLHIEGRGRTPMSEIQQALGIKKNDPILALSLEGMRERLKEIHSIREAAIDRALPNALYVRIVEREPVALWQHQGSISLIDELGTVMTGIDITPYHNLPLIVGDGAPEHVMELMNILASAPGLEKEFSSAIRVADRRWNIRLNNDVEVKLPEADAPAALARLVKINQEEELLKRDIKVIDLRVPDRVFIKLSPELIAPNHTGAKET